MTDAWKQRGNDQVPVRVTYPDGRSDVMASGAAVLLLATRIFYRLGGTVMEGEEGESYETVADCVAAATSRVSNVLSGLTISLDGIRIAPSTPPPA